MGDLFEQVFEVAPVRLENICEDGRVVGMMERQIYSSDQVLVPEFRVCWMLNLEALSKDSVESLIFEW